MGSLFNFAVLASVFLRSAVLAAPTTTSATAELVARQGGCANDNGGVHIIVARGSTEPYGLGSLGALAGQLQAAIPGSDAVGVDWPALLTPYQWSVDNGTATLTQQIKDYVAQCPRSRIVLLGYSQGAQVVMNSLCGADATGFTSSERLPKHLWKHIARVLVYADLGHLVDKEYDMGTATLDGIFPRLKPDSCYPFRGRIRSYCDYNDPYCASGSDLNVHFGYFNKYDNDAAQWLIETTPHHMPWLRKNQ